MHGSQFGPNVQEVKGMGMLISAPTLLLVRLREVKDILVGYLKDYGSEEGRGASPGHSIGPHMCVLEVYIDIKVPMVRWWLASQGYRCFHYNSSFFL